MTTAAARAAAVRAGEISAVDAVTADLAALHTGEDQGLNAYLTVADEFAIDAARAIDATVAAGDDPGPLAGVTVALKDNLCVRGLPATCASKILEGWMPPYHATIVERLRQVGAVIVGKTNLDEFAMGSSTENSAFGATKNPHDHDRVPGGSSGGSAATVAHGAVQLSYGSDTGGSIRQPAALCGVVGVKPTYGRVSRYGLIAFGSSLDQIGPFAADVAGAAAGYDAVAGHDPHDGTSIAAPVEPASAVLDRGVEGLRIGLLTEITDVADPDVRSRVDAAAEALTAGGAIVDEVSVPAVRQSLTAYYLVAPAEASSNLARFDGVRYGLRVDGDNAAEMMINTRTAGFGAEVKARIMLGTFALSAGYYDAYYGRAQQLRVLLQREFDEVYAQHDLLLGATSPTVAFPVGARVDDPMAMYASDLCTIPSNLAGHPAISVPYGTGEGGLPVGVQILAPALGDALMFQAAAYLESGLAS